MHKKDLMAINDPKTIRLLAPSHIINRSIDEDEFKHIFKAFNAFWIHPGDPTYPHVELASGKCSNGYINCRIPLQYTNISQIMAYQVVRRFQEHCPEIKPDRIVCAAYAGIPLAKDAANELEPPVSFASTQKRDDGSQAWSGDQIGSDEVVLQVEDLNTTGGTIEKVRQAIREAHDHPIFFAPVVVTLVDRSTMTEVDGSQLVSVVHFDMQDWAPAECPLCKQGSKRIKPKGKAWFELLESAA